MESNVTKTTEILVVLKGFDTFCRSRFLAMTWISTQWEWRCMKCENLNSIGHQSCRRIKKDKTPLLSEKVISEGAVSHNVLYYINSSPLFVTKSVFKLIIILSSYQKCAVSLDSSMKMLTNLLIIQYWICFCFGRRTYPFPDEIVSKIGG